MFRKRFFGGCRLAIAAFTLASLVLLPGCSVDSSETDADDDVAVEVPVRVAEPEPIVVSRTYTGRVEGLRDVEVRARVSGILEGRGYREGELVAEDRSLFQIDPTRYEVRVQRAEAELEQARATLQQAERVWDRVSELHDQNAASGRERDEARSALEMARAGEALAEADLADARLELDYTVVTAPVEGIAGLEQYAEGSLVEAGTLLTTLTQLAPIHVRFSIPESHMAMFGSQVRAGAGVRVRVIKPDGDEHPEPGSIDFVESAVDAETGTVRARGLFPNNERSLLPGQFVRITLSGLQLGLAVTVPHRAIAERDGGPVVYVLDDDDALSARQVELGDDLGAEVLVRSGLDRGDRVVVDGLAGLSDGDVVTAVAEEREVEAEEPQVLGVLPPANVVPDPDEDAPEVDADDLRGDGDLD